MPYLALISGGGEFQFFNSYTNRTKQHSHGKRSITASMVAICDRLAADASAAPVSMEKSMKGTRSWLQTVPSAGSAPDNR